MGAIASVAGVSGENVPAPVAGADCPHFHGETVSKACNHSVDCETDEDPDDKDDDVTPITECAGLDKATCKRDTRVQGLCQWRRKTCQHIGDVVVGIVSRKPSAVQSRWCQVLTSSNVDSLCSARTDQTTCGSKNNKLKTC